ncbi:Hypothetical predicted protein [Pelobates cultripes]|uniref:Uncharacterized protein n=1 Tax=Pelobates cultripes TaxID=61616 RepID=A0AAD1SAK8_PELCU|nr:Hypothetical predicted protein [Pelobates cultripes]
MADQHSSCARHDMDTEQCTSELGCYCTTESRSGSRNKPYASPPNNACNSSEWGMWRQCESGGRAGPPLTGRSFSDIDTATHDKPVWAEDHAGDPTPQAVLNHQEPQQPPTGEELGLPCE